MKQKRHVGSEVKYNYGTSNLGVFVLFVLIILFFFFFFVFFFFFFLFLGAPPFHPSRHAHPNKESRIKVTCGGEKNKGRGKRKKIYMAILTF